MALKPLEVFITGNTDGLDRALSATTKGLKTLATVGATASVALVGSLAAIAAGGISAAKEIDILAKRANATPEAFQKMAVAARTAGIENDKLSDILQDVNDRVGDFIATGAGPMADFFENIAPKVGVTAEQFERLSGPQALQLYVDSLEKANVSQQEMTFYMEAMASDATMLIPLLANGGEQIRALGDAASASGQIISGEMISSIAAADTAIKNVSASFQALQLRLSAELAPVLTRVSDGLVAFMASENAARAIDGLASSFGSLIDVVLSDDFLNVVTSSLSAMAFAATNVASGMVYVAQNVEVVTVALSGLAVALALVGGPIWAVAAALSAALVGISVWRGASEDAVAGSEALFRAQEALNASLGVFNDTSAPQAGAAAIALARNYETEARAALAAAEASIALQQARISEYEATNSGRNRSRGALREMNAELEVMRGNANAAQSALDGAQRTLQGLSIGAAQSEPASGGVSSNGFAGRIDDDSTGLGGAGQVAEDFQSRLEALIGGMATEKETIDEYYAEGLETLIGARNAGLITEAEFNAQREALAQEHSDKMVAIKEAEEEAKRQATKGALSDLASLMTTGNKTLFKIGQAAAIANATVSGYEAAVDAWKAGMKVGGPAAATAFTAASLAKTGALISSIAGQSATGSSSSVSSASSSVATTDTAAQTAQSINVSLVGDNNSTFSLSSLENLFENINEGLTNGLEINLSRV